jgi:hypothetical protein
MAKTKEPLEEMSALAAQTMEKTRLAADNYFNFLQKSMSSYPWGGTELGETLKHFAEQNIAAVHEFARRLSQAETVQGAIQIQTEFMKAQFETFAAQTKTLGEVYMKAAVPGIGGAAT